MPCTARGYPGTHPENKALTSSHAGVLSGIFGELLKALMHDPACAGFTTQPTAQTRLVANSYLVLVDVKDLRHPRRQFAEEIRPDYNGFFVRSNGEEVQPSLWKKASSNRPMQDT